MSNLTERDLTELIVHWVRDNRQPGDPRELEITSETDLMAAGLLDSFGFVDLLLFVETQTGIKIDLLDVDPSEFTIVKNLCRLALGPREAEPPATAGAPSTASRAQQLHATASASDGTQEQGALQTNSAARDAEGAT